MVEQVYVEELVHPSDSECEEIARYHFHTITCEDVRRYLDEGQKCFVARYDHKIVGWLWIIRNGFYDYRLHRLIGLSDTEDYYLGLFTIPEFRGKGIMDYLYLETIQIQLKQSHILDHCAIAFVDTHNISSQKVFSKVGFDKVGHIGLIGIFGLCLEYIIGRNVLPKTKPRYMLTLF
jgi:GNAT superfamily N-acetyltransferase